MISLGLDYSVQHTESQLARLKGKGAGFVVRYLTPAKYPKRLTRAEAQVISRVGLNLVSVFQYDGTKREWFSGNRGARDAGIALENAREVGQPEGSVIYFAVDYDTRSDDVPTLREYFSQVQEVLDGHYRVGVYGSYHTVEALKDIVPYLWQTYAWSAGKVSAEVDMVQFLNGAGWAGGQNDLNLAFGNPGFWRPDGAPYATRAPNFPPAKRGDRGDHVAALQTLLSDRQIDAGPIDGIYGPKTEVAVRAFQGSAGLPVTGRVDEFTWNALLSHEEPRRDAEPPLEISRLTEERDAALSERDAYRADNDRLAAAMRGAVRTLQTALDSDPQT